MATELSITDNEKTKGVFPDFSGYEFNGKKFIHLTLFVYFAKFFNPRTTKEAAMRARFLSFPVLVSLLLIPSQAVFSQGLSLSLLGGVSKDSRPKTENFWKMGLNP